MNEGETAPWQNFTRWVHSISVVTFDLELGQALEIIYPGDAQLSSIEKTNMCYLALPDSNFGSVSDVTYHFRIRRTWPKTTPLQNTLLDESAAALPLDASYIYGFVHFRQQKDATIPRGYYQKSVVLLTPLPFFALWRYVTSKIARSFFDLGETALEAACHDLDQWPAPLPGTQLVLPIMGAVVQTHIPCRGDVPFSTRASVLDENSASPQLFLPLSDTDIYRGVIPNIQLLWELVLIGEPLLVVASSPTRSSALVQALVTLIAPLRLHSDYRPYFTIHDSEFREPCAILGVTNPFFIKALPHWPHVLKVTEESPKNGEHQKQPDKTRNFDKLSLDSKPGLYTLYKPFLVRDKHLVKKLTKGSRPDEVRDAVLQRQFLELTQSFMIPLERYLSSLMPLKKTMSAFKAIPHCRPFVLADFLASVTAAGPSLTCGLKGDWEGLYRRFASTPTFAGWLAQRNADIAQQLRAAYIEEVSQADLSPAVLAAQHHPEIVEMVLRIRRIALQLPASCPRRAALTRQIAAVVARVDDELRGVLMSNCALRELLEPVRDVSGI